MTLFPWRFLFLKLKVLSNLEDIASWVLASSGLLIFGARVGVLLISLPYCQSYLSCFFIKKVHFGSKSILVWSMNHYKLKKIWLMKSFLYKLLIAKSKFWVDPIDNLYAIGNTAVQVRWDRRWIDYGVYRRMYEFRSLS